MADGTSYTIELLFKAINQVTPAVEKIVQDLNNVKKAAADLQTAQTSGAAANASGYTASTNAANAAASAATAAAQKSSEAAKQTQTAQVEAASASQGAWAKFGQTVQELKDKMGDLNQLANQLAMSSMRTIMAGAAVFAAAYYPVKEAAEFEHSMSLVNGILKASSFEMTQLKDAALLMAKETVFSANQAAEAMQVLARSGLNTQQVLNAIPDVLHLAAAGELQMGQAASIAAEAIHAFNLKSGDFSHVADVYAHASTSANVSMTEIAEAMKYVAPAAKAAGMGVDEIAAALQVLANAGIRASMGGTVLRSMLMSMSKETKATQDAFYSMGIAIYDSQGKMRPMLDILTELSKANFSLDQATQIFTVRAAAGALALTQNVDSLRQYTDEAHNATGEAKRLADVVLNNVVGAVNYLESSFGALAISASEKLLPALYVIVHGIAAIVNAFASVLQAVPIFQFLTGGVLAAAASMGGLLIVLGGTGLALSGALRLVAVFSENLKMLSGAGLIASSNFERVGIALAPVKAYFLALAEQGLTATLTGFFNGFIGLLMKIPYAVGAAIQGIASFGKALALWVVSGPIPIIITALALLATGIYYFATMAQRAGENAMKMSTEATESRKGFDQLYASLHKATQGTAEHDKAVSDLITKFPALAHQIDFTNQSWEKQKEILDNFKLDLVKDEMLKAADAIALMGRYLADLEKNSTQLTFFQQIGALAYGFFEMMKSSVKGTFTFGMDDKEIKDSTGRVTGYVKSMVKDNNTEFTKAGEQLRQYFQTVVNSMDFTQTGTKSIDLIKSTDEQLKDFIYNSKGLEDVRKEWQSWGWDLKDIYELLLKIYATPRAKAATQVELAPSLDSADEQRAQRIVGDLTTDISQKFSAMPDYMKRNMQMAVQVSSDELSKWPAAVQKYYLEEMKKAIDENGKLGDSTEGMMTKMITIFQTIGASIPIMTEKLKNMFPDLENQWKSKGAVFQGINEDLTRAIKTASSTTGVPEAIFIGLGKIESGLRDVEGQVTKTGERAQGVWQIMPSTMEGIAKGAGKSIEAFKGLDGQAEAFGLHFRSLMNAAKGDMDKAIAYYILGQGRVDQKGMEWARAASTHTPGITTVGGYIDAVKGATAKAAKEGGPEAAAKQDLEAQASYLKEGVSNIQAAAQQGKMVQLEAHDAVAAKEKELADNRVAQVQKDIDAAHRTGDFIKEQNLKNVTMVDALNNVKETTNKLDTERAKILANNAKLASEVTVAELQANIKNMQDQAKIKQTTADKDKAQIDAMYEARTISGIDYARRYKAIEDGLFQNQIEINNAEIELVKKQNDAKMMAISKSTADAPTKQLEVNKEVAITQQKINDLEAKNTEQLDKQTKMWEQKNKEAAKGLREDWSKVQDIGYEGALGPLQEQEAKFNKLLKDDLLTREKLNQEIEKYYGWLVATGKLTEGEGKQGIANMENQLAINQARKEVAQSPYAGVEAKRWADQMTSAISSLVDAISEGSTKMRDALNAFFKSMLKTAMEPMYKQMQQSFTDTFTKMFQVLGGGKAGQLPDLAKGLKTPTGLETATAMQNATAPHLVALQGIGRTLGSIDSKTGTGTGTGTGIGTGGMGTGAGSSVTPKQESDTLASMNMDEMGNPISDEMMSGAEASGEVFASKASEGMKSGAESSGGIFSGIFSKIFGGSGGGSQGLGSQMGVNFGNALMGAISMVGMLLTSKSSASATPSGVTSGVSTHEAVRGVIAGETSIPIAQISISIQEAFAQSERYLAEIAANTRGGKGAAAYGGSEAAVNFPINLIVQGVTASIKDSMDQYFREYLIMGAK